MKYYVVPDCEIDVERTDTEWISLCKRIANTNLVISRVSQDKTKDLSLNYWINMG